jgi:cullin 3
LNTHSSHKLEWRFDQGSAEITVDFSKTCTKALVVSTYQMMILLMFNSCKRITYKQILDVTSIPRNSDMPAHLLSLCHPKVNVLLKRPNTKKLEDSHQFMLNPQYTNPLRKVIIPLLRVTETDASTRVDTVQIDIQRRHQIDAAIVRIMKSRKTLRHQPLVAEVINQIQARFKPTTNDIKKRIEALIDQEYLERDETDKAQYNYRQLWGVGTCSGGLRPPHPRMLSFDKGTVGE